MWFTTPSFNVWVDVSLTSNRNVINEMNNCSCLTTHTHPQNMLETLAAAANIRSLKGNVVSVRHFLQSSTPVALFLTETNFLLVRHKPPPIC